MSKENGCKDGVCKKTSIGGQALIEGIMRRGPFKTVISCRKADGTIVSQDLADSGRPKPKLLTLPVIRGVVNFVQSMITGYKALMLSVDLSDSLKDGADAAADSDGVDASGEPDNAVTEDKQEGTDNDKKKKKEEAVATAVMAVSVVLGVVVALMLMFVLPSKLFDIINMMTGGRIDAWRVLIEGVVKMSIFVIYLAAVSMMKDIRRVFQYHGAEHKSIFCYENGLELTVENVRKQKRFHPRCGTSFMILMLIVSILFYSLIVIPFPWLADNSWLWILLKIVLLPIICGIGYELIRFCGRHDNAVTQIISAPGVWLQRLTTKEPDDSMIEVAIDALTRVIPEDRSVDKW